MLAIATYVSVAWSVLCHIHALMTKSPDRAKCHLLGTLVCSPCNV